MEDGDVVIGSRSKFLRKEDDTGAFAYLRLKTF